MKPGGRRTGVRLRELAARWSSADTLERYIDPVLADLQAEYEEAVRRGRTWQSRWIWIRGHAAFLVAIACCGGSQGVHALRGMDASERSVLMRTAAWALVTMMAGTVILTAVPFLSFVEAGRPDAARLAVYLVPQALPSSICLGLTLGVIWGMGRTGPSRRSRMVVLLVAAALSVASFAMVGWVIPTSNQAFRVAIFAGPIAMGGKSTLEHVPKGLHELTIGELRRFLDPAATPLTWPTPDDIRKLTLQYHRRWAAACAPLVVSFFVLVVIGSGHRSRLLLALASFVAVFGYYFLLGAATIDWMPPAFAAWLPNAVFFAGSIAGTMIRSPGTPAASA